MFPVKGTMLKKLILLLVLLLPVLAFSQKGRRQQAGLPNRANDTLKSNMPNAPVPKDTVATIDMYRIITLQNDTIQVDTTLTIQQDYKTNYLRKDNFGLLVFPNEGHTYNTLFYGLNKFNPFPEFGFKAKHFAYQEVDDINYYHVATPYTDLMYRSVIQQGQILDATFSANTSQNFNLFIGYKGIRSIGKYLNSIASNGNFRMGFSYNTTDMRYRIKAHFTGQDFSNQENGGITVEDIPNFELSEPPYDKREGLDVYFRDATSVMKGNRYFFDHYFRLNKTNLNSIVFHHQFNYEHKFFEFDQPTPSTRFGPAITSDIYQKTRYNRMYNLVGAAYSNETIGAIEFYLEDYNYNYFYRTIILGSDGQPEIPNAINDRINTYGARYTYQKGNWKGTALLSNSITDQSLANIDLQARYKFDDRNEVSARFQNMNKLPDLNYRLYQSDYEQYNWFNNFNNEKINSLQVEAKTKWVDISAQYTLLKDHLFFENTNPVAGIEKFDSLLVKPLQYGNTISYFSVKAGRDFKFLKYFGLDNTVLYQNVQQDDAVLNVPEFLIRSTFYYDDRWFQNALQIQSGFTLNYFTEYYMNDYNPLISEFYVQRERKIGNFPTVDFFLNLKIQEFRLFLKAEHFNSSMTGYNYYSAPNYPYRDFTVRFGIIWNFFS
ncbi:Putative porin [Flavobacterium akiainvivens]|nr:Putative porin [Flavobacterium akiainvivens]